MIRLVYKGGARFWLRNFFLPRQPSTYLRVIRSNGDEEIYVDHDDGTISIVAHKNGSVVLAGGNEYFVPHVDINTLFTLRPPMDAVYFRRRYVTVNIIWAFVIYALFVVATWLFIPPCPDGYVCAFRGNNVVMVDVATGNVQPLAYTPPLPAYIAVSVLVFSVMYYVMMVQRVLLSSNMRYLELHESGIGIYLPAPYPSSSLSMPSILSVIAGLRPEKVARALHDMLTMLHNYAVELNVMRGKYGDLLLGIEDIVKAQSAASILSLKPVTQHVRRNWLLLVAVAVLAFLLGFLLGSNVEVVVEPA